MKGGERIRALGWVAVVGGVYSFGLSALIWFGTSVVTVHLGVAKADNGAKWQDVGPRLLMLVPTNLLLVVGVFVILSHRRVSRLHNGA